ncbi:hypothetical protein RDWZM_003735 [Blomia tropicalis]|uniref:UNC-45/Cro1/She4 central domain-containing protein n=1 Tax=Blomia tropicalis TaxID=40697 RepID=A0A9Q0RSZ6_BLOTA|nr:hypothetical protein RDWZM_003735 [Blomia tropicalis]
MASSGAKDAETLWKRCREMEAKENYAEAFKTALYLQRIDPKNEEVIETLRRLNMKIQKFNEQQNSTENRVRTMLKYLTDNELSTEKRIQVANNLVALAREDAGRKCFVELKGFDILMAMMRNVNVKYEVRLALIRVLSELSDGSEDLGRLVLKNVGVNFLVDFMSRQTDDQILGATQTVIQTLLTRFSGFSLKECKKVDSKRLKQYEVEIDAIMSAIVERINARTMTGKCRDSLLELIMVNTDYTALDWGKKLVDQFDGLYKLLEVASELQEIHYESSMEITGNTRTHVALTLEKVYMCMDCDKLRDQFHEKMMEFINGLLRGAEIETKVRATAAITALLNGPLDAGNFCLGQQGVLEMMLVMANSGEIIQQCVAAEAIIAAASKKDKGKSMAQMGSGILKSLYESKHPKIKVRALVGLCKLGSVGGTDSSVKTFSEESTMKLMKACCTLLCSSSDKDKSTEGEDVKKWAADGLAYLSLDGDVKEALIEDKKALNTLIDLGKNGDLSVLFGVVTTFVNLTNSYDKQDILPELIELAKFSKQHVPEEHEFDATEFIYSRCRVLAENHVTSALVALCRSKSKTSREMICRVFNAICEIQELRGKVVQEGGAKALIRLALENNTDYGKKLAAQSLARIAITNNPDLVFPGQRSVEVVGPIMELLHPDCPGLQNFEALMALANLAQTNVSVRNRILRDGGYTKIEQYTYEDHDMIKRAAVQCIVNLILAEQVVKLYEEPSSERVKYLMMLTAEDDLETVSAAAGALAMLTSVSAKSCAKVFDAKSWLEYLIQLTSSKNTDLQHRGVVIVHNLIAAGNEPAQNIVESQLFELLMAIVRPEVDDIPKNIKDVAAAALEIAEEQKLIKNVEKLKT